MQKQSLFERFSEINFQKAVSDAFKKAIFWFEQFFKSRFFNNFIFYAKAFSIILSIILLITIILLFAASSPIERFRKYWWKNVKPLPKTKYQLNWAKIERRISSKQEAEYKLAVIEADKIIDNILFLIGYKGNTLGDKLKKMNRGQLACLDDVWEAHKLRNRIVHYPDERVSFSDAEDAIAKFKKGLEELGVL